MSAVISDLAGRDAPDFVVRSERDGAQHVVQVFGELDLCSAVLLERALIEAEASDALQLVLDLSALEFIDSTGIGMLVAATARDAGRDAPRLAMLRPPEPVQRVIELSGVAGHLPLLD